MKSCNTRAGDESKLESGQEQQTARTEGCCVPDGGACALVSSAALRSDSAAQPAGTERKHGPLQNSPAASTEWVAPLGFEGKCSFPCAHGSQLKAGPCYVDTAGWRGNHLQRPSVTTKWNGVSTHENTCCTPGNGTAGAPLLNIKSDSDEGEWLWFCVTQHTLTLLIMN